MHVEAYESLEELRALMKGKMRVRDHRRIHAVVLAREGKTAPEIAGQLACGRRPVQRWIERYNKGGGVAGLAEGKRGGRPARLRPEQESALGVRLEAGPQPGDETCVFHGKDIRRILEREFNVLLKLSAVYELLHRLNYSHLCPRPHHPQADPAAQAAFKKTWRDGSSRSKQRIPTSG